MTFWGKIFGLFCDYYIVQVDSYFLDRADQSSPLIVSLVKVRDDDDIDIRQRSNRKDSTQQPVRTNEDPCCYTTFRSRSLEIA